jgi:uncharacterized protein
MTESPSLAMRNVIDIVVGVYTPEVLAERPSWSREFFGDKLGSRWAEGVSVDDYLGLMDASGIERSLLFAPKCGPSFDPEGYHMPPERVQALVSAHPDRFSGLIGLDPTQGMGGVADLVHAITAEGFIGAHAYPHWFGVPPDDRLWYPFYAKCCELDIPIQIQVGHCLLYSPVRRLESVGRPITLDTVACHFPELKIVGIHTGWPWVEELMSVAYKHPNVYIGTDAHRPRHWSQAFAKYVASWGQGKVMFGTDFPVIDPADAVQDVLALGLDSRAQERLCRQTAMDVFGLTAS